MKVSKTRKIKIDLLDFSLRCGLFSSKTAPHTLKNRPKGDVNIFILEIILYINESIKNKENKN